MHRRGVLEARKVPWCLLPLGFAEQCVCVCFKKPAEEAVSALPSLGLDFPKHLGLGCILVVFFYGLVGL